jgi:aminoglycoside 6'-N-acetyltransferase
MATLRPATVDDVPVLERWDRDPGVIAAAGWGDEVDWREEILRGASWQELLIAEEDGRPVGCVQIIDPALEASHYWGDDVGPDLRALDIWIGEQQDRGRGVGAATMRAAIERCFADPGVTAILIDPLASNVRACRFYERLGFRFVEERWFGDDHCRVYRLDRPAL